LICANSDPMGQPPASIEGLVKPLLARIRPRAKSLIVSIYGDAILPHGGSVWLGSLIRAAEPLGLSERMVRTAVFRLAKDGVLVATQSGRRSYYALTEPGRHQFESAQNRIYAPPERTWDGTWVLAIASSSVPQKKREVLRRELGWLGFALLGPTVLACAGGERVAAERVIRKLGLADSVVLMRAEAEGPGALTQLRGLIAEAWPIDHVGKTYEDFLEIFGDIRLTVDDSGAIDPELSFLLRVLLIHEYRRALLRDPGLPRDLLPPNWPGLASANLARDLYRLLAGPAERHVMARFETLDGELPAANASFQTRFGGLARYLL